MVMLNCTVSQWEMESRVKITRRAAILLSKCRKSVFWETLPGLVSLSFQALLSVLSHCELSCTGATGSNTKYTWHRGCLQTSWLEANFHLLFKIKSRHVSAVLLFGYTSCQCIFSPPRAETLRASPSSRQTDRQCGRGAGNVGVGFTSLGVSSAGK